MINIALLPLDERPCNYCFPDRLFAGDDIKIYVPEKLGTGKRPADRHSINSFLENAFNNSDVVILSMDMLIYGGLIPSRLHHLTKDELECRLNTFRKLKEQHKDVMVYAFQCIMRCPNYSSSAEEPDYYSFCGKELHDYGEAIHMEKKNIASPYDIAALKEKIDDSILNDYTERRAINLEMDLEVLSLVKEGLIDQLIIPQDDSSVYGFSAMDKEKVQEKIRELDLGNKVLTYPGADEVGLTLISRFINHKNNKIPRVYVRYINEQSKNLVPLYEGQPLQETVSAHLTAAGCVECSDPESSDVIIALTGPGEDMLEAPLQNKADYVDISATDKAELVSFIEKHSTNDKPIVIADNAYANGGDIALIESLNKKDLLLQVSGYAGWNTNANTLGTSIAQAVYSVHFGKTNQLNKFILERYLEDVGYCALVRGKAMELSENGRKPFLSDEDISDNEIQLTEYIDEQLHSFLADKLSSISSKASIDSVSLPWHRLFEVNLTASL